MRRDRALQRPVSPTLRCDGASPKGQVHVLPPADRSFMLRFPNRRYQAFWQLGPKGSFRADADP